MKRVKKSKGLLEHVTKLDLSEAFDRYDEKNKGYRDQILTGIDGVMKELETMREENAAGTSLIRRLTDRVDDHETRFTKLESPGQ